MFILYKKATWISLLALGMCVFVRPPTSDAQEKSERKVIKKVDPVYPQVAAQLHLSGSVKMVLQVAPDGKVESVHTTGGSPVLVPAAETAVKQWKYEEAPKESSEAVTVTFEAAAR